MDPLTDLVNVLVSMVQEYCVPDPNGGFWAPRSSPGDQAIRMLERHGRLKIVEDGALGPRAEWIRGGQE